MIACDGFAQLGDTIIIGVEGFARLQSIFSRLADEIRRRQSAFPDPEGNDVFPTCRVRSDTCNATVRGVTGFRTEMRQQVGCLRGRKMGSTLDRSWSALKGLVLFLVLFSKGNGTARKSLLSRIVLSGI